MDLLAPGPLPVRPCNHLGRRVLHEHDGTAVRVRLLPQPPRQRRRGGAGGRRCPGSRGLPRPRPGLRLRRRRQVRAGHRRRAEAGARPADPLQARLPRQLLDPAGVHNFLAAVASANGTRRIGLLRCDDDNPSGLLSSATYGDLHSVTDRERRRIILAVARGEALAARPTPRIFGGAMPPENRLFTGREAELDGAARRAVVRHRPSTR